MQRRILVIDESRLIRDYLSHKLGDLGFEVVVAQNGLEGGSKIRASSPDLVIMDHLLARFDAVQVLEQKQADPNARDIPVIMLSTQLTRERILELARFRVRKFLAKPLKIDTLINAISEILGTPIEVDDTPCIVDVHFNDGILFVEVARGLNSEKIELLPYKIREVLGLYQVDVPKVLIMMTDMRLGEGDAAKLHEMLASLKSSTGTPWRGMKLLTTSDDVRQTLAGMKDCEGLEVAEDITRAMDGLLGVKVSDFAEEGKATVKQGLLQAGSQAKGSESPIRLQFQGDSEGSRAAPFADLTIAVVDDDEVVCSLVRTTMTKLGCTVKEYANGRPFLDDLGDPPPALIFLDLLMPDIDGFGVLAALAARKLEVPVVVLSALSKKETVLRAGKAGVKSYMIKPIKPEQIVQKALEVGKANF